MDYVLALATMFVVFVVPLIILVAIVGAPISRGRSRRPIAGDENGTRQTLTDGSGH